MASASSSEARELELVGKVEMRIALSKDEKLESVLKVYLPPLLLKLASDHVAVRNKVCVLFGFCGP
jgi:proteasome component ECM29